jgi:polysaccharide export outer membrane protein
MKHLFLLLGLSCVVLSCSTKKQVLYFQDIENLNNTAVTTTFDPIIEPNDVLYITLSSLNEEVLKPFQKNKSNPTVATGNANIGLQGYLVNVSGNIPFPVIGELQVAGKTRKQVEEILKQALSQYITDVVVDVRIINFRVTVIGEVNNPGVFSVKDERITLPEAIGLAGDFTLDGNRKNITIIREEDGKRKVTHIDFTKADFFTGDFYYLKQNDVVYVAPTTKGVKKTGFIPDVPALLSLFTVVLSSVILLTR